MVNGYINVPAQIVEAAAKEFERSGETSGDVVLSSEFNSLFIEVVKSHKIPVMYLSLKQQGSTINFTLTGTSGHVGDNYNIAFTSLVFSFTFSLADGELRFVWS